MPTFVQQYCKQIDKRSILLFPSLQGPARQYFTRTKNVPIAMYVSRLLTVAKILGALKCNIKLKWVGEGGGVVQDRDVGHLHLRHDNTPVSPAPPPKLTGTVIERAHTHHTTSPLHFTTLFLPGICPPNRTSR